MTEFGRSFEVNKGIDALRCFLKAATSVFLFLTESASEFVSSKFLPFLRQIFELVLIPELLKECTAFIRVAVTQEYLLARGRRHGLLRLFLF